MDSTIYNLDRNPQLFIDNALIECCYGVRREWHKPTRRVREPLIVRDRPWEQTPYFTYSNYAVLQDPLDGKTKCWYEDLGEISGTGHGIRTRILYAESVDGIQFVKPELDICTYQNKPTNIVMGYDEEQKTSALNPWSGYGIHSNGIVIDPNPPTPEERFRTIFTQHEIIPKDMVLSQEQRVSYYGDERAFNKTCCAHSADGKHWIPYKEHPTFAGCSCVPGDVSCVHYDSRTKLFVMNTRHPRMYHTPAESFYKSNSIPTMWSQTYYPERPDLMNKRRIYQTTSTDFLHWSDFVLVAEPDDELDNLDEAYYGMAQFRVGGVHFGTMGLLRHVENEMDVRLVYSRDGVKFKATDTGKPFLSPRGDTYWDSHLVSITTPPIVTENEWLFYHGGASSHHDYWITGKSECIDLPEVKHPHENVHFCLGIVSLRKNGVASLATSSYRKGFFITRPVYPDGTELVVNARCRRGGSVRAEYLDIENHTFVGYTSEECQPFIGDSVVHEFKWNGNSIFPAKKWIKVRFILENAEIFSFSFE